MPQRAGNENKNAIL